MLEIFGTGNHGEIRAHGAARWRRAERLLVDDAIRRTDGWMVEDPGCRAPFVFRSGRARRGDATTQAERCIHVIGVEPLEANGVLLRHIISGWIDESRLALECVAGYGEAARIDLNTFQLAREIANHRWNAARVEARVATISVWLTGAGRLPARRRIAVQRRIGRRAPAAPVERLFPTSGGTHS